jgi:hypothetical protein
MKQLFGSLGRCAWSDCKYRFEDRPCEAYTTHIGIHPKKMETNYCLWSSCTSSFTKPFQLARHISEVHGVLNRGTIPTRHYYCYEHDT